MKKLIWLKYCVVIVLSVLIGGNHIVFASKEFTYNELQFLDEDVVLTDDILNLLTVDDYFYAFSLIENDEQYWSFTEKEQNKYMENIYLKIANEKNNIITPFYLPKSYEALNTEEKKLVKKYPAQAALVYTASKLATNRANALYKNGLHNGNGDAFRHVYWNAEMVTMLAGYGSSFRLSDGKAKAKRWADAHENGAKNQPNLEKKMDLHNNSIGRSIVTKKMSSKSLESESLKMVNNGYCRRISGGKLVKTTSSK